MANSKKPTAQKTPSENKPERPKLLTVELASDICGHISMGKTMKAICELDGYPTLLTIYKWLNEYPDFKAAYEEARKLRAHSRFDDIDGVVKEIHTGQLRSDTGKVVADLMRWQCAKDNDEYSDKITQKHTGANGEGIEFVFKSILEELPPSNDIKLVSEVRGISDGRGS